MHLVAIICMLDAICSIEQIKTFGPGGDPLGECVQALAQARDRVIEFELQLEQPNANAEPRCLTSADLLDAAAGRIDAMLASRP